MKDTTTTNTTNDNNNDNKYNNNYNLKTYFKNNWKRVFFIFNCNNIFDLRRILFFWMG
ncbi:MAG: hypothetical protein ACRC1M_03585 [Methanobacteriaceae archaeon]